MTTFVSPFRKTKAKTVSIDVVEMDDAARMHLAFSHVADFVTGVGYIPAVKLRAQFGRQYTTIRQTLIDADILEPMNTVPKFRSAEYPEQKGECLTYRLRLWAEPTREVANTEHDPILRRYLSVNPTTRRIDLTGNARSYTDTTNAPDDAARIHVDHVSEQIVVALHYLRTKNLHTKIPQFEAFCELAASGRFYDVLADALSVSRDAVKLAFSKALNARHLSWGIRVRYGINNSCIGVEFPDDTERQAMLLFKIFRHEFPALAKAFRNIARQQKLIHDDTTGRMKHVGLMSWLLARFESTVRNGVVNQLSEEAGVEWVAYQKHDGSSVQSEAELAQIISTYQTVLKSLGVLMSIKIKRPDGVISIEQVGERENTPMDIWSDHLLPSMHPPEFLRKLKEKWATGW